MGRNATSDYVHNTNCRLSNPLHDGDGWRADADGAGRVCWSILIGLIGLIFDDS